MALRDIAFNISAPGVDQAVNGINRVNQSLSGMGDTAEKSGKRVATATGQTEAAWQKMSMASAGVVAAMVAMAYQAAQYIKEATTLAARVETLGVVMKVVGNNAGYTGTQMDVFTNQVKAMGITTQESMNSLIKMAGGQMDLTKASQLARVAQDAAVIGNINSSEAFGRMIQGIRSGEVEILKTIGINVQFEEGYKKTAAALDKTSNELSVTEKTASRMNAVLDYGSNINGAYEASLTTAGKQMLSMSRYTEELKLAIGQLSLPTLTAAILDLVVALKNADSWLKENKGTITAWGDGIATTYGAVKNIFLFLASALDQVGIAAARAWQFLNAPAAITGNQWAKDQIEAAQQYIKMMDSRIEENRITRQAILSARSVEGGTLDSHEAAILKGGAYNLGEQQRIAAGDASRALEAKNSAVATAVAHKAGLTSQQKRYETQIKNFLKTAWDDAAKELAAEDFSSEVAKALNFKLAVSAQSSGVTKNPSFGLGTGQLQSLEQQEAATKKLTDAEALRIAGLNNLLAIQREMIEMDFSNRQLETSMIDNPYEREKQQIEDYYNYKKTLLENDLGHAERYAGEHAKITKESALLKMKHDKEAAQNEKASFTSQVAMLGNYAGTAAQLFQGMASAQDQSSRAGFESAKNYSYGAAVMSTAAAVIAQLTGPDAWTPAAWARSGVALALGMVQVAQIASTSYGGGGSVSNVSPGSFSGGSTSTGGSVGGSIGARYSTVHDSVSETALLNIAQNTKDTSLAIGKVADGLTKVADLFGEGSFMTLLGGALAIASGEESKSGMMKNLKTIFDQSSGIGAMRDLGSLLKFDLSDLGGIATRSVLNSILPGLGGFASSIFGGDKSIEGQGIALSLHGSAVSASGYTAVKTDGGWFGSDSHDTSYVSTPEFQGTMQKVINSVMSTINHAAIAMGTRVDQALLTQVNLTELRIDTRGKTAEDINTELQAWLEDASNALSKTVQGLQDFAFYGENAFDALVRLSTALQSSNEGLELIGARLITSTLAGANAAFKVQDMMGGAEEFASAVDNYFTSMFSDTEQDAMRATQAQRQVNTAFAEMRVSIPRTNAEFISLVNGLDLTQERSAGLFAALMDISDEFALVQESAAAAAKTIADRDRDLQVRELTALGLDSEASLFSLQQQHNEELREYYEQHLDITRLLKVQQLEYAAAVKKAAEATREAANALNTTLVSTALNAANALKTILGGTLSTKSPETLYAESQAAFAAAMANNRTAELPALGQALLTASRGYNASGAGYVSDYELVTAKLMELSGMTGTPTLDAAERQIQILTDIQKNTALTAGATQTLNQMILRQTAANVGRMVTGLDAPNLAYDINKDGLLNLQDMLGYLHMASGLPAFAGGGITNGLSLAGEAGPEAVIPLPDGRNVPVRMTGSADNKELIAEIRELRKEVAELKAHTAANVRATQASGKRNADANERTAAAVERSQGQALLARAM